MLYGKNGTSEIFGGAQEVQKFKKSMIFEIKTTKAISDWSVTTASHYGYSNKHVLNRI